MPVRYDYCILTGRGSFVWRLIIALHRLRKSFRYVLYLQEDMWLTNPISEAEYASWIELMAAYRLDCLKLSSDSVPPDCHALLAAQPPLGQGNLDDFTWYGPHNFLMSHHGSIFRIDYLLKSLIFAYLMGARKPKQHEILVSRAFQFSRSSASRFFSSPRVVCWRNRPLLSYVHASDGGDLTPEALALLRSQPLCPPVDESLPGEVFPARCC